MTVRLPYLWICREVAVNWIGYKLRVRRLFRRKRNNNVHFDVDTDVREKGYERLSFIKDSLRSLLGDEEFLSYWPPRRVVEMGPGGTLVLGLLLISEGVEEYMGIDEFPSDVLGAYPRECYRRLFEELSNRPPVEAAFAESVSSDSGPIRYYGTEGIGAFRRIASGSVDLIFSWGCLEHVLDPLNVFKESKSLLSPAGIAIHTISTHGHTWRPLKHLIVPDWLWSVMYWRRGFINRFMPRQYIEWARKADYHVTEIGREYEDAQVALYKPAMLARYQNESDAELRTAELMLALRSHLLRVDTDSPD